MSETFVVVGCGIVGLYTTYCLIFEANVDPSLITIVAEFIPGDQSTFYTSPWAGGNFSCISPSDPMNMHFDRYTYTNLENIQQKLGGPSCGLDRKPAMEYWELPPDEAKLNSLKEYLKDFKILPKEETPQGVAMGISYSTWNFNCPLFLENFANFLKSLKVTICRKKLTHISQAFLSLETKAVFNCSGIGSKWMGGVKDDNVYSTRGQVVVVKAPHIQENITRWGKDYATYVIPRPFSNGELVLGGFMHKDIYVGDTFGDQTDDILARTTKLLPQIKSSPIDIIRVVAGLRPSRHGGTRIELQKVEGKKFCVHNYGAGGYGYQSGFGMAHEAVKLFNKEIEKSTFKL